jgi:hypothetical protein
LGLDNASGAFGQNRRALEAPSAVFFVAARLIASLPKRAKGGLCQAREEGILASNSVFDLPPSPLSHFASATDFFLKSSAFGISGISRSSRILRQSD